MVIEETREGIRVSEVPWLELEPTLDSGQCFRFRREEDGCWTGVAGQHPLTLPGDIGRAAVYRYCPGGI